MHCGISSLLRQSFQSCFVFLILISLPTVETQTVHSMAFEDGREGMRLHVPASFLSTQTVTSETKCGLACTKNEDCRSFNFCNDTTCELNKEDVFSTENGDGILQDDPKCNYFGMKKRSIPLCQKDGIFAEIEADSNIQQCGIYKKRVDSMLGMSQSEVIDIDTKTEWRKLMRAETMVDVAHGGIETETDTVVEWLIFVHTKLNWFDAKENCVKQGGRLFSNLDGTETQLQFLLDKMEGDRHWVGISTDDHQVWKTSGDEVVATTNLRWIPGEPNNYGGTENCALNGDGGRVSLNDASCGLEAVSICDML